VTVNIRSSKKLRGAKGTKEIIIDGGSGKTSFSVMHVLSGEMWVKKRGLEFLRGKENTSKTGNAWDGCGTMFEGACGDVKRGIGEYDLARGKIVSKDIPTHATARMGSKRTTLANQM